MPILSRILIACLSLAILFAFQAQTQTQIASHPAAHNPAHASPDPLASAVSCQAVTNLAAFVDTLPIPATALPARTNSNYPLLPGVPIPEYDMIMTNFLHSFHRDLPPVEVWGYAGSYPGPTIEAATNAPILVNWINRLPAFYPDWLAPDTNNHGVPDLSVRTVVHLHGGANRPQFDGYPGDWFRTGESRLYFYENIDFDADGETLWYHDHALGATANNVYAGLEGFYFLRNPAFEAQFQLPSGAFEIPLVFQDRDIQTNCQPATLMFNGLPPWHNLPVVNGKVLPYLQVEPRRYRFRILNGSNFRAFGLQFATTNNATLNFNIIGNESGFLPNTVSANNLKLMSAERIDVLVDFTAFTNQSITLINSLGNADVPFAPYITNLMQFQVTLPLSSPDATAIPSAILTNWIPTSTFVNQAITNREITLDLCFPNPPPDNTNCVCLGGPFATDFHVNALINLSYFEDPITEMPHAGDTEIWSIINLTSEAHPIHVHLLDFRVVDRQPFAGRTGNLANTPASVTQYINDRREGVLKPLASYLSSTGIQTAQPFESGPKDVVHAAPFAVTRIVMQWPNDARFYDEGDSPDAKGRYVYHCHILDHEDNDMMRPMKLLPPREPNLLAVLDPAANPGADNKISLFLPAKRGETYRLQTSAALSPLEWISLPLPEILGAGNTLKITPPPATGPMRFYRAQPVAPPRQP